MIDERRLNLDPLKRALSQFDLALSDLKAEPDRRSNRDSVALHYMIVWNLLIQAITRYLELQSVKTFEASDASFQKLIRRADALGLLQTGWPHFGRFREARNAIAHMYDQPRANIIVQAAPDFAIEAHFVLDILRGGEPMENVEQDTSTRLGLSQTEFEIVTSLLRQYVSDRPVWAFGSRTFGRARRRSDLDIAIGGTAPLPISTRIDLAEAFDESDLPIEVDLVDLNEVTPEFRKRIEPDFIALVSGEHSMSRGPELMQALG